MHRDPPRSPLRRRERGHDRELLGAVAVALVEEPLRPDDRRSPAPAQSDQPRRIDRTPRRVSASPRIDEADESRSVRPVSPARAARARPTRDDRCGRPTPRWPGPHLRDDRTRRGDHDHLDVQVRCENQHELPRRPRGKHSIVDDTVCLERGDLVAQCLAQPVTAERARQQQNRGRQTGWRQPEPMRHRVGKQRGHWHTLALFHAVSIIFDVQPYALQILVALAAKELQRTSGHTAT